MTIRDLIILSFILTSCAVARPPAYQWHQCVDDYRDNHAWTNRC